MLTSFAGHLAVASLLLAQLADAPRERDVAGVLTPGASYFLERATLFFVEEEGHAELIDRPAPRALDTAGLLELNLPSITLAVPELSDLPDAEGTTASVDATSQQGTDRRALLELYVGQIRARIERAWERAAGSSARCIAAIDQDLQGTVLDIDLNDCDLPDAERQELLAAIRRASPLPAPPDTRVFMAHLSLDISR